MWYQQMSYIVFTDCSIRVMAAVVSQCFLLLQIHNNQLAKLPVAIIELKQLTRLILRFVCVCMCVCALVIVTI